MCLSLQRALHRPSHSILTVDEMGTVTVIAAVLMRKLPVSHSSQALEFGCSASVCTLRTSMPRGLPTVAGSTRVPCGPCPFRSQHCLTEPLPPSLSVGPQVPEDGVGGPGRWPSEVE